MPSKFTKRPHGDQMRKLSGWQKAGVVAGVGCFSIVAIIVIGIAVAFVWARRTVAQLGDTTPTSMQRTIPLAELPLTPEAPPAAAAPVGNAPLRLTIDLEEGSFTIRPGAPGGQVQIQGTFASALYELTEDHQTTPNGARQSTIRFRSKAPQWARIFSGIGGGDQGRPELTVLIPPAAPMDLTLRISMGESRIDLGGLTLGELDLNLSMGEHRVDFGQPVVGAVRRLRLDTSMGNVSVENMGNARPEAVETSGSMGNLTADLGGQWVEGSDTSFTFSQSMGELTLRVPTSVRLETDFRNAEGAPQENRPPTTENPTDPNAPRLRLRVLTSMGDSRVIRY
jgi:hypothetical protein